MADPSKVLFTVLPAGAATAADGRALLRLSVFVSPRLQPPPGSEPVLGSCPGWDNWPLTLSTLAFKVEFLGGGTAEAVPDPKAVAASSEYWEAAFPLSTPVTPFLFRDFTGRLIRSYPAANIWSFLRGQYLQVAQDSPDAFPAVQTLSDPARFGQIRFNADEDKAAESQLNNYFAGNKVVPPLPPNPKLDMFQLRYFHRPANQKLPKQPKKSQEYVRVPLSKPVLDFHQRVAVLGHYPQLLRRLGLVVDLVAPVPRDMPAQSRVALQITAPTGLPFTPVYPKTYYSYAPGQFAARPQNLNNLVDGFLNLNTPDYEIIQVDLDGAATKAMDLAGNLASMQAMKTADTPTTSSLPTLRTVGFAVAHRARGLQLRQRILATKAQNDALETDPANTPDLYAEDLVRGYRVDVWDQAAGQWRSVCRRIGNYQFLNNGAPTLTLEDEGDVSMGLTSAADKVNTDLYLLETLFRWDGWSLAAPRPGKVIPRDDRQPTEYPQSAVDPDLGMAVTFTVPPGSLPRLRFGHPYKLRARAVDLAGNSAPFDAPGDAQAIGPELCLRHEPVGAPAVVLRKAKTRGEFMLRMVIRSNYNVPAAEISERHLAPPITSQLMAEQHGMFDQPSGLDKAAYSLIVSREGSFKDGGVLDQDGQDYIQDTNQLALPYLPDVLAHGVTLRNLPGAPPAPGQPPTVLTWQQPFADPLLDLKWPARPPFRIRIEEGESDPEWVPAERLLRVRLPKAVVRRVPFSSFFKEQSDLEKMAVWDWLPDPKKSALFDMVMSGEHWMLTPWRELVLVHAVRQPLLPPDFATLDVVNRAPGDTFVSLSVHLPVDSKSTARLDADATWQEWVDRPELGEGEPKQIDGANHAFDQRVDEDTPSPMLVRTRHEFGDTKHRMVNYQGEFTTRFTEYFRQQVTVSWGAGDHGAKPVDSAGVVKGTEVVQKPDRSVTYTAGADYTVDYAAGTIARPAGSAIPDGADVLVDYVAPPISRTTAAPKLLNIPSSARPAAPKLLYIVPTFGWARGPGHSTRTGRGLRIYLDRPWYSSGDGELLGVVLHPGPAIPADDASPIKAYITQYGADPIWKSGAVKLLPARADFTQRVAEQDGLSLDEVPGAVVSVAGHQVEYDSKRKLWYCDLEVDAGNSYYPFVRLALARYQPSTITAPKPLHLSRVVLGDFAQLTPNRTVNIVPVPRSSTDVKVTVQGLTYGAVTGMLEPAEVWVQVEQQRPNPQTMDPELRWLPVGSAVQLPRELSMTGTAIWTGTVRLPAARGSQPFRLVIREYEQLPVSAAQTQGRLVFAEAIVI